MSRIIPTFKLQGFRLVGLLTMSTGRIWVTAVSTDQTINHEFEHTRRLIPINGSDYHDPVRCHPLWINLAHPVSDASETVIRVARTGPVTERHRRWDKS